LYVESSEADDDDVNVGFAARFTLPFEGAMSEMDL